MKDHLQLPIGAESFKSRFAKHAVTKETPAKQQKAEEIEMISRLSGNYRQEYSMFKLVGDQQVKRDSSRFKEAKKSRRVTSVLNVTKKRLESE